MVTNLSQRSDDGNRTPLASQIALKNKPSGGDLHADRELGGSVMIEATCRAANRLAA
jgi:hypothetical protein